MMHYFDTTLFDNALVAVPLVPAMLVAVARFNVAAF